MTETLQAQLNRLWNQADRRQLVKEFQRACRFMNDKDFADLMDKLFTTISINYDKSGINLTTINSTFYQLLENIWKNKDARLHIKSAFRYAENDEPVIK